MLYSIVVIVYNEEKFILRTLESIKYQIQKYGNNREFQLIIGDDCSTDRTRDIIDYWLKNNREIFKDITFVYQEKNVGTSRNVIEAEKAIKGQEFYFVAGDDMLADLDVFSELKANSDVDILATACLIVENNHICQSFFKYADVFAQSFYTSDYIKWTVSYGSPGQAGISWNKKYSNEKVFNYMRKTRLIEDRPRFYAIWKHQGPVTYRFISKPFILHVSHEKSVTKSKGLTSTVIKNDLNTFMDVVVEESENPLNRLIAILQKHSFMLRESRLSAFRFLTPYYCVEMSKRLFYWNKMKKNFDVFMKTYYQNNTEYLQDIIRRAEEGLKKYENQTL